MVLYLATLGLLGLNLLQAGGLQVLSHVPGAAVVEACRLSQRRDWLGIAEGVVLGLGSVQVFD